MIAEGLFIKLPNFMKLRPIIYFIVIQCFLLCSQNVFVYSKPMHGVNVRDAAEGEFPFVVSIINLGLQNSNLENSHICTGVLITNQDVLTAAHCLEEESLYSIGILVGSSNIRTGIWYSPLWWMTYNQWAKMRKIRRQFQSNDISNIRLCMEVPDNIIPATISNMPNYHYYGLNVRVVAWGNSENGGVSPHLKTVDLTVLTKEDCENRIFRNTRKRILMNDRRICTVAQPYALMNDGDSGGPVLLDDSVIGIQEATAPLHDHTFYSEKVNIHTGVHFYMNFILDVANKNFIYS